VVWCRKRRWKEYLRGAQNPQIQTTLLFSLSILFAALLPPSLLSRFDTHLSNWPLRQSLTSIEPINNYWGPTRKPNRTTKGREGRTAIQVQFNPGTWATHQAPSSSHIFSPSTKQSDSDPPSLLSTTKSFTMADGGGIFDGENKKPAVLIVGGLGV
jgi:hypothetical protein